MTAHVTQREPARDALTGPHQGLAQRWSRRPLQQVSHHVRQAGKGLLITVAMALSAALLQPQPVQAFSRTDTTVAESAVALSALPRQAQDTHSRILAGGPFRFDKDGTVFGNRERLLPRQKRGYYREYTVTTPGVRHRGARRIVCGGPVVQSPETCFYTQDHYQSFQKIDPRR